VGHREQLLHGALECLERQGYAHTTARDIVAASGTNLASIGYHYGSKEALLTEAMVEGFRRWTAQVEEAVLSGGEADPPVLLARALTAMRDGLERNRGLSLAFVEAMAQADRAPALREAMAAYYREVRERVGALARAALGPELSEEDAAALASLVLAVCDGLVVQWLLAAEDVPSGERLAGSLAALLTP
jgi:AcrR family transcriptional regulator